VRAPSWLTAFCAQNSNLEGLFGDMTVTVPEFHKPAPLEPLWKPDPAPAAVPKKAPMPPPGPPPSRLPSAGPAARAENPAASAAPKAAPESVKEPTPTPAPEPAAKPAAAPAPVAVPKPAAPADDGKDMFGADAPEDEETDRPATYGRSTRSQPQR
jgi:hypothetical protein